MLASAVRWREDTLDESAAAAVGLGAVTATAAVGSWSFAVYIFLCFFSPSAVIFFVFVFNALRQTRVSVVP